MNKSENIGVFTEMLVIIYHCPPHKYKSEFDSQLGGCFSNLILP